MDFFSGTMKLRPETDAERAECAEIRGIRRRLNEYAFNGVEPLVKAIFDAARHRGLSGEDTMTLLAFESLQQLEHCKALLLEQAMLAPAPPRQFWRGE